MWMLKTARTTSFAATLWWMTAAVAQLSNVEGIAPMEGVQPSRVINAMNDAQREDKYWDDVKMLGSKEAFEAYLNTYPRGRYVNLAKANLTQLKSTVRPSNPKMDDSDIGLMIFKSILEEMINNKD